MNAEKPDFAALVPALPVDPDAWDRRIEAQRAAESARRIEAAVGQRATLLRSAGFPGRSVEVATQKFRSGAPAWLALSTGGLPSRRGPMTVVVLSGGVGSGKTCAATRWAAEGDDGNPLFIRAATFEACSRYDRKWRERWTSASSLVLDDLGAEYGDAAKHFLAGLDELFDVCYSQPIPCVITTNMSAAAFRDRYGERIASRLRECAKWRNVTGPDLRTPSTTTENS